MRQLLTFILLFQSIAFAKEVEVDTFLIRKEAEVKELLTDLRNAEEDVKKEMINTSLIAELQEVLAYPGAMEYEFSSWTTMSTITSPDAAFRIFNWNIEDQELNHSHYCYLITPRWGDRPNRVYEFKEDQFTLPPHPTNVLTPNNWYGALYYKIIPVEQGNKTYYTVLGYSGKNRSTNQKLIDVFYFKGKSLRLGHPLFQASKDAKQLVRRVFFEYSEKAVVSLNVNEKLGGIVFDHLVPEQKNLEGMYDFYIPDMTYDSYVWDGEIWRYKEDVIAYNDPNESIKQWHPSDSGDSSEFVSEDNEWINPVDPDSPVNSGGNPIAPIEDVRDKKTQKKDEKSKKNRKTFRLFKRKSKNRSAIKND
ncbi:MAG: hypothetical protein WDZ35_07105 [Crocinitomicaceae bacterium]